MNRALKRRGGRIFADHYRSHLLRSPAETRNALRYVSGNAEHHFGQEGLDWFSSQNPELRELLEAPKTWLLSVGFRSRRAATLTSPPPPTGFTAAAAPGAPRR
jgi:hypothetical protein